MKTKIAVLFTIIVFNNASIVWGQNQMRGPGGLLPQVNNPQGVLAVSNWGRVEQLNEQRRGSELRRLPASEQPDFYKRLTEERKDEFDSLNQEGERLQNGLAYYEDLAKNNKAALLREKTIPLDPWRKINGKVVYVLSSDSGFMNCAGTVSQTIDGGVLVKSLLDITGDYFIKGFPFQVADGYELDASKFMAMKVGLKKLTTVLGEERTVTELDYGKPCERPEGGEKIEAEAKAPTPYEQKQLQEIESSLTEKRNAADAAIKRAAELIQKFEDDKIMEKQRQDLIKETAKKAVQARVLKGNQDLADKGDAYGLLRMGESYRDGEGVPKDLAKAKDYLTKAAAAGSPTAADALLKLNQVSTNSPATQ